MAEESVTANRSVCPHHLFGERLVGLHRVLVERPSAIPGGRRIDVAAGINARGVQVGVDLENVGLRRPLVEVLVVIKY